MSAIIGVDIGGTFADFAAIDIATGEINTLKVLTTPNTPGQDIAEGLSRLVGDGLVLEDVQRFVHGTTVGVNTILQRKGARLALFTTAGFTDILELARLRMPNPYSLFCERPSPLVAREHVFPIDERMNAMGASLRMPQRQDVEAAVGLATAAGCEVIVVSFLHAWREARHERQVADMIAEAAPNLTVFCGSEVWPVIREYERTSTAVLNAYVQPRINTYLQRVSDELVNAGVRSPLLLTTSVGGTMTAEAGRRDCVGMLLSGTASGVVGASLIAKAANAGSVLTLDIGGTSADVALLENGEPSFSTGLSIGEFPLATSTVAVQSSGHGGGSIVWVDAQGVLQAGPESAGSTPGPACFGRGGLRMTVTDAAMISGILGHGAIGFGAISPSVELAERSAAPLARALGISTPELAEGALKVAVSGMLIAIEQVLAKAGVHASELTLMPFGGAGPMLGAMLAEAAGIKRILVPATPGTLSALGAAAAAVRRDTMRTILLPLSDQVIGTLGEIFEELERDAEASIFEMVGSGNSTIRRSADLRYKGQSFEITVPVEPSMDASRLTAAFHEAHDRAFGHADPDASIQVVNLRVSSSRAAPDIRLPLRIGAAHPAEASGSARLFAGGKWANATTYSRDRLTSGATMAGPAIIVQSDSTLLIPAGWNARVDNFRNIEMEFA